MEHPKVISVFDHPSNTDKTARLVSGPRYEGRDIYRIPGKGYVALLGDSQCFAGWFDTEQTAKEAQIAYHASVKP